MDRDGLIGLNSKEIIGSDSDLSANDSDGPKKYVIEALDPHSGSIIVSEEGKPANFGVIVNEQLHVDGTELMGRRLAPAYGGSLLREDVVRITGGKESFSVDELMVLHRLMRMGVSYASKANLVLSGYGKETERARFESSMKATLPSLQELLDLVNGELPVEDLICILMRKLQ